MITTANAAVGHNTKVTIRPLQGAVREFKSYRGQERAKAKSILQSSPHNTTVIKGIEGLMGSNPKRKTELAHCKIELAPD